MQSKRYNVGYNVGYRYNVGYNVGYRYCGSLKFKKFLRILLLQATKILKPTTSRKRGIVSPAAHKQCIKRTALGDITNVSRGRAWGAGGGILGV